jgi:hypothetical protein
MKIGFTGSRQGMSQPQMENFVMLLKKMGMTEFHHGDCVGADEEAHAIVRDFFPNVQIVIHPPTSAGKRAFCVGDETRESLPYLTRDRKIVDECEFLFAAPLRNTEELRSGTWSTIRYARKIDRLHVVLPR